MSRLALSDSRVQMSMRDSIVLQPYSALITVKITKRMHLGWKSSCILHGCHVHQANVDDCYNMIVIGHDVAAMEVIVY